MVFSTFEDRRTSDEFEAESDSSDEDLDELHATYLTTAHEALLRNFADSREVRRESVAHQDIGRKGKSGLNILHLIVARFDPKSLSRFHKIPFPEIRPLLDEILKQHPGLLLQPDDNCDTALNRACSKKKWQHLNYFLECEGAVDAVSKSLKSSTNMLNDLVALHIRKLKQQFLKTTDVPPSTSNSSRSRNVFDEWFWRCIDRLIAQPMKELGKKPGDKGNTALHLAVVYCNEIAPESQITLIRKILGACPELMMEINGDGRSPYQHRVHTRDEAIERAKRVENRIGGIMEAKGTPINETLASAARAAPAPAPDVGVVGADTKPQESETDPIASLLKEYYMNHEDQNKAAKCLYGAKEKRLATEFDLSEHSHTGYRFSANSGEILNHHLKFEKILRYVDLPKIFVAPELLEERSRDPKGDGTGCRDLEVIFDWLREAGGVEKIIRVKVDDRKDIPHSDESIEKCLKNFGIEVWDWNKIDLCCSTILKTAPDVREVHLYCSGNNAVLRSWSSTDGLPSLQKLETLHVTIEQGLESRERAKIQLENFKKTLERRMPTLKLPINAKIKKQSANKANIQALQDGEIWVKHMDHFVNFIVNLVADEELRVKPVKVALIDDGVDGSHPRIGKNIKDGISFCVSSGRDKHLYDYWAPSGRHGTQMASLIKKVCPEVELYVARLQDVIGIDRRIDPASAVKAIDWAIEREVDIISMSWTFEQTTDNKDVLEKDLTSAIKRASAKNILMFCSTGDQGRLSSGRTFPACLPEVFKIGAASPFGKERHETEVSDFLLPGENLETESPSYIQAQSDQDATSLASGSSLATALASGLAALLLYCIDESANEGLRDSAKNRHNMERAFTRMSAGGRGAGGAQYLKFWDLLQPQFKEIYKDDPTAGNQKLQDVMKRLFE